MQLLKITTTPIKYELEVEHARLELNQKSTPNAEFSSKNPQLSIDTRQGQMNISTYKARNSIGMYTVKDRNAVIEQDIQQHFSEYIRQTIETGKQLSRIDEGTTIGQIVRQRMLEQPQLYTAFIPSSGAEMSWEPGEISMDYQKGEVDTEFSVSEGQAEFIPGSVHLKILENLDVQIEYIGGPVYFPKSMDPKYANGTVG